MTARRFYTLLLLLGLAGVGYVIYWYFMQFPRLDADLQTNHGPYNPNSLYIMPGIILLVSFILIWFGAKKRRA